MERDAILDVRTHFKLRHFIIPILLPVTCKELKKASLKGKPSDSSEQTLQKYYSKRKLQISKRICYRGVTQDLINTTLSEVYLKDRKLALQQKPKTNLRILPFVTQYQPSVPDLKQILMKNWHLIERNLQKNLPSYLTKEGGCSKTYS